MLGGNTYQTGIIRASQTPTADDQLSQSSIQFFLHNGCYVEIDNFLLAHQYSPVKLEFSKRGSWRNMSSISERRRSKTLLRESVAVTPILFLTPLFTSIVHGCIYSSFIFINSLTSAMTLLLGRSWEPTFIGGQPELCTLLICDSPKVAMRPCDSGSHGLFTPPGGS